MRWLPLPLCTLVLAGTTAACGVPQARHDTLRARADRLERRARAAEAKLARCGNARRCPRARRGNAKLGTLKWKLGRCQRALAATKKPLVLANHTREQDVRGGKRRTSTVTLLRGTVVLPLSGSARKNAVRSRQAQRAERSLRKALARRLSQLAGCYHRLVKKRRRPPDGQLSFAFKVLRTGRVQRVTVVHRQLRDWATVRCATHQLRRLRFPRQRRAVWAVFPVEFQASRPYASGAPVPARR